MAYQKIKIRTKAKNDILDKNYAGKAFLIAKKLSSFFPKSPDLIVINVFEKRTKFLKAIKKKNAPNWLIGSIPSKSTSIVFFLNKEGKISKKTVQILTHEIAHLYINKNNPNLPNWIKEGLSVFLAKQIFSQTIKKESWEKIASTGIPFKQIKWHFAAKHNGYDIAGLLVFFLIKKYGKKNFIETISSFKQKTSIFEAFARPSGKTQESLLRNFFDHFVKSYD